ncbi:hypothetical protein CDAR_527391 [Caerostris darwini]|uniref:Uncharacterized protein n=1 Tax=Caerostris darwini TaxID=1538125 RepID=A0AAV4WJ96_9ARAC|nr:hypothetical protein CDAR_527391 [Caerostris darwini]
MSLASEHLTFSSTVSGRKLTPALKALLAATPVGQTPYFGDAHTNVILQSVNDPQEGKLPWTTGNHYGRRSTAGWVLR